MVKAVIHFAWKHAPAIWELYRQYKEFEREYNAEQIRKDPAVSWNNRFRK